MKLTAVKKKIRHLRARAKRQSYEAAKKKGDAYSPAAANWWAASWAAYNRVLNMLEEVDKL